jgi:hypothetical protein
MTVDSIVTYLQAHGTPAFGEQVLMLLERSDQWSPDYPSG